MIVSTHTNTTACAHSSLLPNRARLHPCLTSCYSTFAHSPCPVCKTAAPRFSRSLWKLVCCTASGNATGMRTRCSPTCRGVSLRWGVAPNLGAAPPAAMPLGCAPGAHPHAEALASGGDCAPHTFAFSAPRGLLCCVVRQYTVVTPLSANAYALDALAVSGKRTKVSTVECLAGKRLSHGSRSLHMQIEVLHLTLDSCVARSLHTPTTREHDIHDSLYFRGGQKGFS
jgi:hypothetical protein